MNKKFYSLIGLAMKAGAVQSGEFQTEKMVKDKQAKMVIVAEDASENTKKLFTDKCSFYSIPCFIFGSKESLGKSIGKEFRASLAITDENFSNTIIKAMNSSQENMEV